MPWLPSSALLPLLQEQSQKLNSRVTQLAGVVSSNKADQAHLNAQVNAELKRIGKVGDDRYKEHLKKDASSNRSWLPTRPTPLPRCPS